MANGSDGTKNDIGGWVKRNIAPLITVSTFITIMFGGYFWLEMHYATANELDHLEQRFEIKVRNDILRESNARIWQLEERLKANPKDVTAKEELRKLREEKNRIERELDALTPD